MTRIPLPAAIVAALACQAGSVAREDAVADSAGAAAVAAVSVIRHATPLNCGEHEVNLSYEGDSVIAIIDGTRLLLRHAPADSVERYVSPSDSGTLLTRGDATTIRLRGEDLPPCGEQSSQPFVARGHEPGWILRIIGETITYIGSYGEDTVNTTMARVSTTGGVTTYTTPSSAGLTVTVRDEPCGDGATGMPHPYAVTVTHGTATVHGCGGEPSSMLVGEEWVVTEVGGTAMLESPPTMTFTRAGRVGGSTSCNRYSGPYHLSGEGLRFGAMTSTKMACAEPRARQEVDFLQLLGQVTRFDVAPESTLRLLADDGRAVVARRQ